jgi:hypothetical protein
MFVMIAEPCEVPDLIFDDLAGSLRIPGGYAKHPQRSGGQAELGFAQFPLAPFFSKRTSCLRNLWLLHRLPRQVNGYKRFEQSFELPPQCFRFILLLPLFAHGHVIASSKLRHLKTPIALVGINNNRGRIFKYP